jgi:hypothetical protein
MAGQARHLHVTPGWGLVGVRLLPAPFYLPYCRGLFRRSLYCPWPDRSAVMLT